jgi:hypothetical protein
MMRGLTMTSMTSSMFMLLTLLLVRSVLMMVHFFWLMFCVFSVIHLRH